MFSATKLVAGGAVLALTGGLFLSGVLTTSPDDLHLPGKLYGFIVEPDEQFAAQPCFDPFEQVPLDPELIELPGKLAGSETPRIIGSFKVVQLFENNGRNDHIVLFKGFKAVGRIKDNVGIDDEVFQ